MRLLLKYDIFASATAGRSAAHLAGTGCLGVQCVDERSNTDGQRIVKNWQLGLKEHMRIKTSETDSKQ